MIIFIFKKKKPPLGLCTGSGFGKVQRPALQQTSEVLRDYATAAGTKEAKVR
ncbi:hypothetical protein MKW98_024461, partial [Papaver atlanticum]